MKKLLNSAVLKHILIMLFVFSSSPLAISQRKDTDAKVALWNFKKCRERVSTEKASIRILYAFNAENIKDKDTWIDEGQLKIGKNITQYSSRFVELNEDSLANWLNTHPKSNVWPAARWLQGYKPGHWIEYQYSTILTKNNLLEEFATMPDAIESDNQKYAEQLPLQDWSILDESKEVCGYTCRKAVCHWRGRDYVAWFTTDIPVSAGPWKFGGLPGLIMKIADSTNTYSWEATEVKNGTFPIYEPRGAKYKESTRKNVQELQRKLNENYFKTTGTEVIQYKTGKIMNSRKHPYSQLELE
ncbi:MAG: GLPGLI family protein [Muribaculaceae bacterium]